MPAHKKHVIKNHIRLSKSSFIPLAKRAMILKSQNIQTAQDQNKDAVTSRTKRRADMSPLKNEKIKRSALGNLTNNIINNNYNNNDQQQEDNKKDKNEMLLLSNKKNGTATSNILKSTNENLMKPPLNGVVLRQTKILTRSAAKKAASLANIVATSIDNSIISSDTSLNYVSLTTESSTLSSSVSQISSSIAKIQQQQQQKITAGSTAKTKTEKNTVEMFNTKPTTRRISNEFEKTEDSLYMSALEDMPSSDSLRFSGNFDKRRSLQKDGSNTSANIASATTSSSSKGVIHKTDSSDILMMSIDEDNSENITNNDCIAATSSPIKKSLNRKVPADVNDFDAENMNDPFQVSEYAMDIFQYLKTREAQFPIEDYMSKQVYLSKWMRSLLVDWMVEIQETFELNHETLYLAVKLVDLYLCKEIVIKDKLQLLGAGSLFIACKFDERTPPMIDDFLYICDGAYTHDELIKMEMNILKAVNFDLGIPLSYRFLRRYARCAKVPMPILTLARYILEFSLMDYLTICLSDSQIACAVLYMALRMTGTNKPWTKTLEFYSGYKVEEFAYIIPILNNSLHRKPRETIKTIRNKYSHKIFFEVAKIPLMSTEKLFEKVEFSNQKTKN